MIPYLLSTAFILACCFTFYKLLLQRETFFRLNRFLLLFCLLLSFILPLLPIPPQWSFKKTQTLSFTIESAPVTYANNITPKGSEKVVRQAKEKQKASISKIIVWLYWCGLALLGINFFVQLIIVFYRAYSNPAIKDGKFRIVKISGDKVPCSFGNTIFINKEKYDELTYNQVLLHEKIHIRQRHSIDLILTEIAIIFQWFNPFAWLYRKEIVSNLEFLTDHEVLQNIAVEKASYQISLLKLSAPQLFYTLVSNYSQSLLKKRLVMMNVKRSGRNTVWKYLPIFPLLISLVCLLNQPVKSQNLSSGKNISSTIQNNDEIKAVGIWNASIKNGFVGISFQKKGDTKTDAGTFPLSEFSTLPKGTIGSFVLIREAGTINFTGKFEGNNGSGNYRFTANSDYINYMHHQNIDVANDEYLLGFLLANVKRSYVEMLKNNGYTDLNHNQLIPLAALEVNEAYIQSIKEAGFSTISLSDLIPLRALKIDKAYIEAIRKSGNANPTIGEIISSKSQAGHGK